MAGTSSPPLRVPVAGGGVAGLETLLALRDLAGNRIERTLLTPEVDFVYRSMAVGEPFGRGRAQQVRPYGDVVELRKHAQRRGRVFVPVVPADAAVARSCSTTCSTTSSSSPFPPTASTRRSSADRPAGTSSSCAASWPSSDPSARCSTS